MQPIQQRRVLEVIPQLRLLQVRVEPDVQAAPRGVALGRDVVAGRVPHHKQGQVNVLGLAQDR